MSLVTTDKDIEYNISKHMYIPTLSLFENRLNLSEQSFGGKEEFEIFAMDCAEFIKDYCVYNNAYDGTMEAKKKFEVVIYENKADEVADLKRAYVEYARYAQNDEGDLVGTQRGVNFKTLVSLNLNDIRGNRELSSRLGRILRASGLLFNGRQIWKADSYTTGVRGTDY